jgi:hypothetical protein
MLAEIVRRFERVGDLPRDGQNVGERHRPARNLRGEILALDQLHDEARRGPAVFDAVDLRDVRMIERRERLRLALEPRQPFRIVGKDIRQDLDGDVAIESSVAGTIDLAHAAGADQRVNRVRPQLPAHQ